MKKLFRVGLILVVAGALFWLWQTLFPGDQKVIRQRLAAVSQAASFTSKENPLIRVANVQKLANFFTRDAVLEADLPMIGTKSFSGREELLEIAMAARAGVQAIKVEFLDLQIAVGEDKEFAIAAMTLKAKVAGESEIIVQELRMLLKKVEGVWLINRVETVKTLGLAPPGSKSPELKVASSRE